MKRLLLTSLLAISMLTSWASKGNPDPMTFSQPDGTTINVILHGDEHMHWFVTEDGIILARENNAFYLAQLERGELKATAQLAHNKQQRSASELQSISLQDKKALMAHFDKTRQANLHKISIQERTPAYVSHTGSPKVLVLLAEYSDQPFTVADPQKTFDQFFNAEGEGTHQDFGNAENRNYMSVREYFRKCSRGLYTPEFVVSKPLKVSTMNTYGGSSEYSGNDENVTQLITDCMKAVEGQYNYSDFDNDGDGRIDLVYIIYSGYGQNNGGPANSIWAKTGSTSLTVGDTQLTWYSCASELNLYEEYYTKRSIPPYVNGIGVTCHEISHALGLPDIYPTSASAHVDNQEMEYWDLMDGGEYVANGFYPKDFTAWECEVFGWSTIKEITGNSAQLTLTPLLDGGDAYKFCNPSDPEEYFVMENIQQKGLNQKFPGHGLLVYHVKYPADQVTMNGCPNNVKGRPGMAVVPADGAILSSYLDYTSSAYRNSHGGDPFPGTSNVTTLKAEQNLPNYCWYTGTSTVSNILSDIVEDAASGTVSLNYYLNEETQGVEEVTRSEASSVLYDLSGRRITTAAPPAGIYIQGNKKIRILHTDLERL